MPPVRLAIVGCGAAARGCHLPALPPLKGDVQLTALIDRDPRQARDALELYRELGGTGADEVVIATDPAEAAGDFDAAVVVVPHSAHARTVESLLAAGKHVLLEKPMTTAVEDARRLVDLAADASAPLLAMAHPRRLFPAYAWVKRLIDSGDLGDVVRVDWSEGHPYAWEPVSWSMFDRRLAGGGVLTDTASHVFDTLHWWLGHDVEVVRYRDDTLGGVETDAEAHLRFGTIDVHCAFSRVRDLGISCTVTSTRATVTIGTDFPAGECTLVTADGVELHRGDVEAVAPAQGEWELLFTEQLANFAAAVRGSAAVHSGPEDGLRVVELIQECYGGAHEEAVQPWTTRAVPDECAAAVTDRTVAVTGAGGFIGGASSSGSPSAPGRVSVPWCAASAGPRGCPRCGRNGWSFAGRTCWTPTRCGKPSRAATPSCTAPSAAPVTRPNAGPPRLRAPRTSWPPPARRASGGWCT